MRPVVVFDSGVGGLTVAAAIRESLPRLDLVFVADDAWFPYGPRTDSDIISRVTGLLGNIVERIDPSAVIVACNTASTLVLSPLRERLSIPVVGTVPAIKPAAELTQSGVIGVLATEGTIRRDFTRSLIDEFAVDCHVRLVGSWLLATYAEAELKGEPVSDDALGVEIEPAFIELEKGRTDQIVLACTHYPLLLNRMVALAPWQVNWVDPASAIARRLGEVVGGLAAGGGSGYAIRTSGRSWNGRLSDRLKRLGLSPITRKGVV